MDLCEFKSSLVYKISFQERLQRYRETLLQKTNKQVNKQNGTKQKRSQEKGCLTTEADKGLQSKTILLVMHDNLNIS